MPLYTVAPFITMLLAIALLPLWLPRWWESNRSKLIVSLGLGLPILALYAVRQPEALLSMAEEYVSFIVLLAGLFVISGGVLLRGDLVATPLTNTAFLALGSTLASFIGTTGASMLLIRSILQTNRERTRVRDDVFLMDEGAKARQLWSIVVSSGVETQVTRGESSVKEYSLSADGRRIVAQRAPTFGRWGAGGTGSRGG